MPDLYWDLVEPVWDTISIYDGGDAFLAQYSKATVKQQTLFSAHWAQSEILNGGLGQFFYIFHDEKIISSGGVVHFDVEDRREAPCFSGKTGVPVKVGAAAAGFTLETLDGPSLSLASVAGSWLVIGF